MKRIESGMNWLDIGVDDGVLVVNSEKDLEALSSAILNGGYHRTRHVVNMSVPSGYRSDEPAFDVKRAADQQGAQTPIGMMTAADVGKAVCRTVGDVTAIVTAGTSNAATPGEDAPLWGAGTVNIIVIVNHPMTAAALANAIITTTEAKTMAFCSLDIRSTNAGGMATGTTTDSVAVCAVVDDRDPHRYASTATEVGRDMGKAVFSAMYDCLSTHNGTPSGRSIVSRLQERKIGIEPLEGTQIGERGQAVLLTFLSCHDDPLFADKKGDLVRHMATISESLLGIRTSCLRGLCPVQDIPLSLVASLLVDDIMNASGGTKK